jgi:hypothetical protein
VNKYLPPRARNARPGPERLAPVADGGTSRFLRWVDRVLSR